MKTPTTETNKKMRKTNCSKQRTLYEYFGLDIFGGLPTAGKTKMPVLKPFNGEIPDRTVAFDEAFNKNITDCIVHFYEDDRRFLRLFRNPEKYVPFLRKCSLVIEPDLSQYVNMALQIRYAHAYLNRAMAAYLQRQGANIVPNITWTGCDSYEYSTDGRPLESVIAVNCTGILSHDMSKYLWLEGYRNVVHPLRPTRIIRYGDRMPGEDASISIYFDNERIKR